MEERDMNNSSALWDALWQKSSGNLKQMIYSVHEEEHGPVWAQIKAALEQNFGSISGLNVIEVGAGSGTYGAIFARQGARVTVLDYSENALQISKDLYASLGIAAAFILADALSIGEDLKGKYDVSMSFGLAEHFSDQQRLQIIRSHFELLKPNGMTFISVPNSACWPYRLWKYRKTVAGTWNFGMEIPYGREELAEISKALGVKRYSFFGSSFWASFDFVLPIQRWKNSYTKRFQKNRWLNIKTLKQKTPGLLDSYFGYALVYAAVKDSA
jgi:2-polyprenyl-3-methyl-5-hydroxy-6-metoxy-1,4-benzoquinol methylase